MEIEGKDAETFTQRCRRMLSEQLEQKEFTLSRVGLETLVVGSESYGDANKVANELLLTARELASQTTMMTRNSDAWLGGEWDDNLSRTLRKIASGNLKIIGASPATVQEDERRMLLDLLAIIHRDGGQHVDDVGIEQATADAIWLSAERIAAQGDVREALEPFATFLSFLDHVGEPDELLVFYAPGDSSVVLKVGDFRRADRVLATLKGQDNV